MGNIRMTLGLWIAFCLLISCTQCYVSSTKTCFWHKDSKEFIETFDERSQICCEASGIHNKTTQDGTSVDCCGDKTYDTDSQICCAQNVYHSHILAGPDGGKRRICCGNKIFIAKRSHECCGSNYISPDLKCCGRQTPYNATESTCEYDTVIPLGHGVCDNKPYDKHKQKCCMKSMLHNVSTFDKKFSCCGEKLIDTERQQCCGWSEAKIVQPSSGECCGKGLYDSKTEICCQGNRIVSYGVLQCCGNRSVNTSDPNEGCCIVGKIGRSYKKDTEKCCNGSLQSIKNTKNPTCCGKQLFSSVEQVCCNNKTIINKTVQHHNSCCSKRPKQYSSCNRQFPTNRPKTCGNLTYNEHRDLCCNNKVHREALVNGKRCCFPGTESYHPHNETCCYSSVKDITQGCSGNKNRKAPPIIPGPPGPIEPTQPEKQTKGVCRVCSPHWRPNIIILSIYSKSTNICTQRAMKFVVNKVNTTTGIQLPIQWTWLNVTSKQNIYGEKAIRQNFTLFLPCSCPQLKRMEGKSILLMTNAKFDKKMIFLGDSDLILPGRKKLLKLVKKQSKTCPDYVVKNIASLLQISSLG